MNDAQKLAFLEGLTRAELAGQNADVISRQLARVKDSIATFVVAENGAVQTASGRSLQDFLKDGGVSTATFEDKVRGVGLDPEKIHGEDKIRLTYEFEGAPPPPKRKLIEPLKLAPEAAAKLSPEEKLQAANMHTFKQLGYDV